MDFCGAIIELMLVLECHGWAKGNAMNSTDVSIDLTKLLNNMEGNHHLKLIRPLSGGKAVHVRVGIHIVYIGNFRESDMEYTIEMYFRQYWKDPRLVFPGLNQSVTFSGEIPDILWEPDTYFENGIRGRLHHLTTLNKYLRLYPDGRVLVSTRLTLSCSCDMNFQKFPMDKQTCDLYFASYGFTTRDLIYSWNDEFVSYVREKESAQFSVESFHYLNGTRTYATGDFSYLGIRFVFARRLSFYLTKVYIPAMLVVIVSWLSFFVDKNSAPARVSLGITTVLTMTTLIMGFGQDSLPVVSYVRALDLYLIVCYLLVFASFAEYAVVNYRSKLPNKILSKSPCRNEISSSDRTLSREFSANESSTRDIESKASTSGSQHEFIMENESRNLDEWSRLIFLPTFLVLNVLYWVYFLVIDETNL